MAQKSAPISQGTVAERQFTDVDWRDLFGDEPGVVGDLDGTAYQVVLPTDSDTAQIGSSTQTSMARLAGFSHRIPQNNPEPITIPAASGTARTDIIGLRYDPGFTGLPGPVRLTRISGTSAGLPAYDAAPPGVEDLPLWAITRQPGQALSQATVSRLFPRLARSIDLPVGAPLPSSSPLGTRARQGGVEYVRDLSSSSTPAWIRVAGGLPTIVAAGAAAGWNAASGLRPGCYRDSSGLIHLVGGVFPQTNYNPRDGLNHSAVTLPDGYHPSAPVFVTVNQPSNAVLIGRITTSGVLGIVGGTTDFIGANTIHYLDGISFHPGYTGSIS